MQNAASPTAASHRRALRGVMFAAFVVLAACAPRPLADRGPALPGAQIENVYIATQRALAHPRQEFGQPRNKELNFFRAAISIPPVHQPGQVEWAEPGEPADPARHFVVTDTQVFDTPSRFVASAKRDGSGNETMLFVHGYNNTLSDAMYRLAQIQVDFDIRMPSVLFSWLSSGDPRGYIYDRDSVLFARDDLERVLSELTRGSGDRVLLLAHSMGAHLVMEVMRQAALRGDRRLLSRISGVILMSPDLDPDLFRSQAEAIGQLPQPFMIFVSRQDRALSLASFITGRKPRLGVIDGPEAVAGLDVKVIDFTALADGEGLNHAVPATSPAAIRVLSGLIQQASSGDGGFEDYMVLEAQPDGAVLPVSN
ncbi:Esterase/lipase superfamily enzyme [Roseovarius litoreus]|uniref:Esterase/lipase superfamily enzyme n=1 Tax=Roseovarius litoreus TaxID=1155722 RepID=A0A1M7FL09_9RHOB|nr:alpha/beta fold hydrolase [Roseovarius litoreus]SHM04448.1 Esterase/lipase superfamily enzyme [Roseovarius litoreus]